ncbi:hypothetical protein [uncultured Psychromonas sp.]|uniref:hypothetical protein n=1 Tax=uncultured Psychromonas sp. TaxID=173974 RepID=UPI00261D01EF|nr:hypothetical protein [uncultured Psychromonas sp.]
MAKITNDIATSDYGITFQHEKMQSGELRFRLISEDGSSYIRTVNAKHGVWQNSHYHQAIKETYIVQKGWVAVASLIDGVLSLEIANTGDTFSVQPLIIHNLYLSADSVIHTIKQGASISHDWFGNSDLDKATKHLSEEDIKKIITSIQNKPLI